MSGNFVLKSLYEVPPPLKSKPKDEINVYFIEKSKQNPKLLYEVNPPSNVVKIPRSVELIENDVTINSNYLNEIYSLPIQDLPPPDYMTVEGLKQVEPTLRSNNINDIYSLPIQDQKTPNNMAVERLIQVEPMIPKKMRNKKFNFENDDSIGIDNFSSDNSDELNEKFHVNNEYLLYRRKFHNFFLLILLPLSFILFEGLLYLIMSQIIFDKNSMINRKPCFNNATLINTKYTTTTAVSTTSLTSNPTTTTTFFTTSSTSTTTTITTTTSTVITLTTISNPTTTTAVSTTSLTSNPTTTTTTTFFTTSSTSTTTTITTTTTSSIIVLTTISNTPIITTTSTTTITSNPTTTLTASTTPKYSLYTSPCTQSVQCDQSKGLYCPTEIGLCNCPVPSDKIFCDCEEGYYWNETKVECVSLKEINQECKFNYECDDTLELSCQSNTCQCPSTNNWFWSIDSNTCVKCPDSWIVFKGHCYYVNKEPLTWQNAENWCQTQGANLMKIDTQDEYELLYDFYLQYAGGKNLWVGAMATKLWDFRWSVDNTAFSKTSPWWCQGEPNNYGGSSRKLVEGCVFMWTANKKICLNDYPCSSKDMFVCEKTV